MSDERLARWAAKGSQSAFAVIFERHHQALNRYCHSLVGNGHDAAAQLGGSAAHTIAESRERLRDLTADLGELTEQQRGTLLMRELGGLQFDDISDALQIRATAAKQSVYEARCSLQSLKEGRAMDCDLVRRTLSEGDRRTLRNVKLRGHLRACAGCRDFEAALRHRPAHLAALTPALPVGAAAAILQGLLPRMPG